MKTLFRILLSLVAVLVIIAEAAYADGATFPLNHSITVSGIVPASPARTFAIISDVGNGVLA